MTDLVWKMFEKSGSINYYLFYKNINDEIVKSNEGMHTISEVELNMKEIAQS